MTACGVKVGIHGHIHKIREMVFRCINYGKNILSRNRIVLLTEELEREALNRKEWRRDMVRRFDLQPPG